MSDFETKLDMFRQADKRLEAYPKALSALTSQMRKAIKAGSWAGLAGHEALTEPDNPAFLVEAADFFEDLGQKQLSRILSEFRDALATGDISAALSTIRGLGGLERAWERYLHPSYKMADVFPPPSSYLSDLYAQSVDLFPTAFGPEEQDFAARLERHGNPWQSHRSGSE